MASLLCSSFLRRKTLLSDDSSLKHNDSTSTLVGPTIQEKAKLAHEDNNVKLHRLRELMTKEGIDYYVVPTDDAHGSEYVPETEKRREWISSFTGSAGQAIITHNKAYLLVDSRYYIQAEQQLEKDWTLVRLGETSTSPRSWTQWLVENTRDSKVGLDARLISHSLAASLSVQLSEEKVELVYPSANLVDRIWDTRPAPSKELVFIQPVKYAGVATPEKISKLRKWIGKRKGHVGTIISSLPSIAWMLNLRGRDIPFNPVFQSYLYVGTEKTILFIDQNKINDEVGQYLSSISVETRSYDDVWNFLGSDDMGSGKVLITGQTSYAIANKLHGRFTDTASYVDEMKAVKNDVELEGFRKAYTRDSAAYVRWLAWLQEKMDAGCSLNEWDAAEKLTTFRAENELFAGLAYDNISASGPNAALPHYQPSKDSSRIIDRQTPYLNDSGGQYLDGTIDTTRTMHFGHPTREQSEAFTRVLQGHIAIDSAVFPEGVDGAKLDVFARRAMWQDGLNFGHGTGHGFGSFLTVHEGPQGFGIPIPLVPGHVLTNEPGFYEAGKFGIRLESSLIVKRVQTKRSFGGDIWLGFERLTCVPIQTKMVLKSMLSKEEAKWIKDHNHLCLEKLEPYLQHDRRALKWLRHEVKKGSGCSGWPW